MISSFLYILLSSNKMFLHDNTRHFSNPGLSLKRQNGNYLWFNQDLRKSNTMLMFLSETTYSARHQKYEKIGQPWWCQTFIIILITRRKPICLISVVFQPNSQVTCNSSKSLVNLKKSICQNIR